MNNHTIVIVDDETEMTQLLKIELETEGYKVFTSNDGRSGLALIKKVKPDLLLLDVMMPGLDGFGVMKALKEDPATKKIAIVMLTAKGLSDDIQKGLDLGVDEYITKPFHSGLLIKRIQTI